MSVQATSWVYEHSRATGADRLVMLALADSASREGTNACQSASTLAKMAALSKRTVWRSIDRLIHMGEIVKTSQGSAYAATTYSMPGVPLNGPTLVTADHPCQDVTSDNGDTTLVTSVQNIGDMDGTQPKYLTKYLTHIVEDAENGSTPDGADVEILREDVADVVDCFSACLTANDVKHTVGKTWHNSARLLIDRDGNTVEQIIWLVKWAMAHHFWKSNILSLPKFRAQFERLKLQARTEFEKTEAVAASTPSYWDQGPVIEYD